MKCRLQYDGYRYFVLDEEERNALIATKKNRKYTITDKRLYRVPQEAMMQMSPKYKYLYRVEYPENTTA